MDSILGTCDTEVDWLKANIVDFSGVYSGQSFSCRCIMFVLLKT